MARRMKRGVDYDFLTNVQCANRANKCVMDGLDFVSLKPLADEGYDMRIPPSQYLSSVGDVQTKFTPQPPPEKKRPQRKHRKLPLGRAEKP